MRSPAFWALILAAALLRLWNLEGKSLWLDEVLTLRFSAKPLLQIITSTGKANPPLYFVFQHFWTAAFGSSEVALRFPSVVFGTLAVALTGWLGALLSGRRLAFTAMVLMAVSPMAVAHSQMARGYALFLAFSLASYGCLLAWERSASRRWALAYVLVTVGMCYTHNYCVFNLLVHQLYVGWRIMRRRLPLLPWVTVSLAVLVPYLPWLTILARQTVAVQEHGFWIARTGAWSLWWTVFDYVATAGMPRWILYPYLLLAAAGLTGGPGRRAEGPPGAAGLSLPWRSLLLLWFLAPLLVPFAMSQVSAPIFVGRYTIAAAAAFHLMVAAGLLATRSRFLRAAALVALATVGLISLTLYYPRQWEDWRSVGTDLAALSKPADTILVTPGEYREPLGYYFTGARPFIPLWRQGLSLDKPWVVSRLEATAARRGRLWLVIHQPYAAKRARLHQALEERFPAFTQTERRWYRGNILLLGLDLNGPS